MLTTEELCWELGNFHSAGTGTILIVIIPGPSEGLRDK